MYLWLIDGLVYLGSALMIYNIYGFLRFARFVRNSEGGAKNRRILYIPIVMLTLFLMGYLAVALMGNRDILIAGILFGGSVFVWVMYRMLNEVTIHLVEQEKLKTQLMAAEESNRMKTGFLATMSHEMRTPLNVILGLSHMAQTNPQVPGEAKEQLQKISQSGEHLLQMIDNLLDLNRMENGSLEVKKKAFSMENMLRRIDDVATYLCSEKNLDLEIRVGDGVKGRYEGDEYMIEQVLLAIVNNAVKYTEAPGLVRLSAEKIPSEDGVCRIRYKVADTGIGIDEEFLPKIYEIFAREEGGTTARYGGSGIGLAVTKNKVDLLGGSIEVESEKGKGSVFTVIIPVTPLSEPAEAREDSAENGTALPLEGEEMSLEGKRVLIVEDIPDNAEITADLLELEGVESDHAENGQIAVEMVEKSELFYYDAILMDLRMPMMDGLEATRRIRHLARKDASKIPILALTANAFESDVKDCLAAGMNAHLSKPINPEKLYSALKYYVRQIDRNRVEV